MERRRALALLVDKHRTKGPAVRRCALAKGVAGPAGVGCDCVPTNARFERVLNVDGGRVAERVVAERDPGDLEIWPGIRPSR